MWAGARAVNPYDAREVTQLQTGLRQITSSMPFMYPPSALPLYFPFGLFRFWIAFAAWTSLSIILFWAAARTITKHAALSFLSPHVVLSIALGQTALFTGAATMWGISLLFSQPVLAGACFGIGAALKPQCFFLTPIALVSGRHWRGLAGLVLAWALLAIPTLPLWAEWLQMTSTLPGFLAKNYAYLVNYGATPKYFAQAFGLPILWFQFAGICLGVWIVWKAFRSKDKVTRTIGLIAGTLIASPYALRYELAALAPALVASYMSNTLRGAIIAIPLFCLNVITIFPGLLISSLRAVLPEHPFGSRASRSAALPEGQG
jgi:hypothetical protein